MRNEEQLIVRDVNFLNMETVLSNKEIDNVNIKRNSDFVDILTFNIERKQEYKDLKGARVNITYYPSVEVVAGMDFEIMNVVRIKRA